MARYTEAKCRMCRREGEKLFLKGDRCYTDKCSYERRPYAPGGNARMRRKMSDYAVQLREKQKVRRMYGILEGQFHRYFERADAMKGVTGANLLILLERRMDNVVYRLGYANSRAQARQMVRHGMFKVNGRRVNIPSQLVHCGVLCTLLRYVCCLCFLLPSLMFHFILAEPVYLLSLGLAWISWGKLNHI